VPPSFRVGAGETRQTAAISAWAFANSAAGVLWATMRRCPEALPWWLWPPDSGGCSAHGLGAWHLDDGGSRTTS